MAGAEVVGEPAVAAPIAQPPKPKAADNGGGSCGEPEPVTPALQTLPFSRDLEQTAEDALLETDGRLASGQQSQQTVGGEGELLDVFAAAGAAFQVGDGRTPLLGGEDAQGQFGAETVPQLLARHASAAGGVAVVGAGAAIHGRLALVRPRRERCAVSPCRP